MIQSSVQFLNCAAVSAGRIASPCLAEIIRQSVTGWVGIAWGTPGEMTEELRVPCDHLEKLHFRAHQY